MRCLVTGATGYIGGRLVPRLLADGHQVRCLVRSPGKLDDVPWVDQVEIVRGDVLDESTVESACAGIDVLYYLVHSLHDKNFTDTDLTAARTVAAAAERAGVGRIVYLGGLHPPGADLSPHLASRTAVGEVFLDGAVPAVVLQAAVIVGSGSASFEMLRYLSERLPLMVTPRWVGNRVQPIAVRDVLHYLLGSVDLPAGVNRAFDIGGPDVLTYVDMMRRFAAVAGLAKRRVLPVPLLTPRLSALWVNAVTPVPGTIATPLVESLVHEVVCREHDVDTVIAPPESGLTGYERSVELALAQESAAESSWSGPPSDPLPSDPAWSGGSAAVTHRSRRTSATPAASWRAIDAVGRVRPVPRVPGVARRELRVVDGTRVGLRAVFAPRGLIGQLYRWTVWPVRALLLGRVVRTVTRAAEREI